MSNYLWHKSMSCIADGGTHGGHCRVIHTQTPGSGQLFWKCDFVTRRTEGDGCRHMCKHILGKVSNGHTSQESVTCAHKGEMNATMLLIQKLLILLLLMILF